MIILGFYQNDEELVEILKSAINLLDCSNDFTSNNEEKIYNNFQKNKSVYKATGR